MVSRRTLGRLAVAGTGGALLAGGGLLADPRPALALPTYRYREHGLVLTTTDSRTTLTIALADSNSSMLKVVATNAWGIPGGWTAEARGWACGLMNTTPNALISFLVVRSLSGDKGMLNATTAVNELAPWYASAVAAGRSNKIILEIGNEPNINWNTADTTFVQKWADQFKACVQKCRQQFPNAIICGTALAPIRKSTSTVTAGDAKAFYDNPTFKSTVDNLCDFVGVHFYGGSKWDDQNGAYFYNVTDVVALNRQYFPGKWWLATEFGMGDNSKPGIEKGLAYAQLFHDQNTLLPCNVWGGTYFHLDTQTPYNMGNIHPYGHKAYGDYVRKPHNTNYC